MSSEFNPEFFTRATGGGYATTDQLVALVTLGAATTLSGALWWWMKQSESVAPRVRGEAPLSREKLLSVLHGVREAGGPVLETLDGILQLEVMQVGRKESSAEVAIRRSFERWVSLMDAAQSKVYRKERVTERDLAPALEYWLGQGDAEVREAAKAVEALKPPFSPTGKEVDELREDCVAELCSRVKQRLEQGRESGIRDDSELVKYTQSSFGDLKNDARAAALAARGPGWEHADRLLWLHEAMRHAEPWHKTSQANDAIATVYEAAGLPSYGRVLRGRANKQRKQAQQRAAAAAAASRRAGGNPLAMLGM